MAGPYVYTGSDGAGLSDPFTGTGRYVPGTAGSQQYFGSGTDPFTGTGPRRGHDVCLVTCHTEQCLSAETGQIVEQSRSSEK